MVELETEQARLHELNKPLPPTPPELVKPTRVRVLRSFCVGGQPVQVGSVLTLPRYVAADMIALKKAEAVES